MKPSFTVLMAMEIIGLLLKGVKNLSLPIQDEPGEGW